MVIMVIIYLYIYVVGGYGFKNSFNTENEICTKIAVHTIQWT